eukprot:CAMPEP_0118929642 /NCGR_PEP_ID=MMETSP1169-20130426/6582_1 /TAXON_ID=36882 /ORGANISM="Pyramimonas obovata, Strain CCMP722" /LENGTH=468 /DNA_ID=CAMNT_0006871875 /DNA_START=13 /DNA_END=1420 /DNA_ORIENTATION=-
MKVKDLKEQRTDSHAELMALLNSRKTKTADPNVCCKICLEGYDEITADDDASEKNPLVTPCACRGSAAHIHLSCLKDWHASAGYPTHLRCPTCKQHYFGFVAVELAKMNLEHIEAAIVCASSSSRADHQLRRATAMTRLAQVLCGQGQYEEALPLYRDSLASRISILGPARPEVAESLTNLGELYRLQGNYEDALRLQTRALALRETMLGDNHPDTATSYNNLGVVLQFKGRLKQANDHFDKAVRIYEKVFGVDHANVASLLNNIAGLMRSQGDLTKTLELYQRSLAIRKRVLGPHHPTVAESLNNLAIMYSEMGDGELAQEAATECVTIAAEFYQPDHPEFLNYKGNYGIVQKRIGQTEAAKRHIQEALRGLLEKSFPPAHMWVSKFEAQLQELRDAESCDCAAAAASAVPSAPEAVAVAADGDGGASSGRLGGSHPPQHRGGGGLAGPVEWEREREWDERCAAAEI